MNYQRLLIALKSHFHFLEDEAAETIQRLIVNVGENPTRKAAQIAWKAILKTASLEEEGKQYGPVTREIIKGYCQYLLTYGYSKGHLWETDPRGSEAFWFFADPELENSSETDKPTIKAKTTLIMSPAEATRLLNALNSEGFACPITLDKWKLAFSGVPLDELEVPPLADAANPVENETRLNQKQFSYLIHQLVEGGAITHNNSNLNETFKALTGWSHTITSYASSFASNKEPKGTDLVVKPFLDSIIASFTAL